MKSAKYLIIILMIVGTSCGGGGEQQAEEVSPNDIIGTWKRVQYKPEDNPDTVWLDVEDDVLYYKHLTPTHFNWISYDKSADVMDGAGGGLYTFDGSEYVEDIEFFLPVGSSAMGQSIPFDAEFRDGKWYHTGYIRNFELDAELGEYVLTDSSAITEIWEKVPDDGSNTSGDINLVGTWILLRNLQYGDSTWTEYPGFVGFIKHITPTHHARVQYDTGTDTNGAIQGAGGGTYSLDGNVFTENIEYAFPKGSGQVGAQFKFKCEVEDDLWYHEGWIFQLTEVDGEMTNTDSVYINEVWKRYQ